MTRAQYATTLLSIEPLLASEPDLLQEKTRAGVA